MFLDYHAFPHHVDSQGPPPSKRSRVESECSTDGASMAGPSSASDLDTKLSEWKLK